MCDFKDRYGGYFAKSYAFMEKFHGTATDEEWRIFAGSTGGLNAHENFDLSLVCAVIDEIERVYEAGTSKTQGNFKPLYHASFERGYKIAKRLFFYNQAPSAENWKVFAEEIARIENPSDFERDLMKACFMEFFGAYENNNASQAA